MMSGLPRYRPQTGSSEDLKAATRDAAVGLDVGQLHVQRCLVVLIL